MCTYLKSSKYIHILLYKIFVSNSYCTIFIGIYYFTTFRCWVLRKLRILLIKRIHNNNNIVLKFYSVECFVCLNCLNWFNTDLLDFKFRNCSLHNFFLSALEFIFLFVIIWLAQYTVDITHVIKCWYSTVFLRHMTSKLNITCA